MLRGCDDTGLRVLIPREQFGAPPKDERALIFLMGHALNHLLDEQRPGRPDRRQGERGAGSAVLRSAAHFDLIQPHVSVASRTMHKRL